MIGENILINSKNYCFLYYLFLYCIFYKETHCSSSFILSHNFQIGWGKTSEENSTISSYDEDVIYLIK